MSQQRFEGTADYVATDDLKVAVNAAIALERPLLVKGEPGTGKTVLAYEVAKALNAPLITWHIKSTTKAAQGLYEYDAVTRLRDSQLGDERVKDVKNYIRQGKLWDAFEADERPVLLIDEIDKADIEFPNDLLQELDRMEFYVYETNETIQAKIRPVVLITSNNEKELPDAFLRRCFFHYIRFPDAETMEAIVDVHFPGIKKKLVAEALRIFYDMRKVPGLKKKPSTSELLDWLKLLLGRGHRRRSAARARPDQAHPAAARRASEERAGRAPVRAPGLPGAARRVRETVPDSSSAARARRTSAVSGPRGSRLRPQRPPNQQSESRRAMSSLPTLMPTKATAETFGGVTYHIDGELVPALSVDVTQMSRLFRAPHPALEEPDRARPAQGAEGRAQADDRRHAGVRDRGLRPGRHRLQPRRPRPHRPDPPEARRRAARARAPVPRRHRQHRLQLRARARAGHHAVRPERLLHRQVPRRNRRGRALAARLRQRVREGAGAAASRSTSSRAAGSTRTRPCRWTRSSIA